MAKPIIVMTVPSCCSPEQIKEYEHNLKKKIDDYHIVFIADDVDNVTFQVFSEKDYVHVEGEGLNKVIADYLKAQVTINK